MNKDIYSYIKSEEANFEADKIRVGDNWEWNFRDHVQLIFHLKNGVFYTGENNWLRAFKLVMRPLLRLSYWTEDIEVKDVIFFIENKMGRALSFLIKKFHDEVYVREHDLDTMFDEITESDLDFGGSLVQKAVDRPEVLQLNTVAFCDQTDMLGGPVFFKHHFSPDKLRGMAKFGWGDEANGATISLDELCVLANTEKEPYGMNDTKTNRTPSKTIEVYIGRGNFPETYLSETGDPDYHCNQVQIVAFYTDKDKKQQGVKLYRKKEDEGNLMFHTSEKIPGRALGFSDGEALLHPQIWTNFLTIHKTALIEAASKVIPYTDDENFAGKNNLNDMENLQVATIAEGRTFGQIPTAAPANIQLYQNAINEWFEAAQLDAAGFDPMLGKEQSSGTTFRGQERTVAQGRGWHDRRRGKRAKFIEQIYRNWIIPDIVREITKGTEFLATLTADELSWVRDQMAENYATAKLKEITLDFDKPTPTEEEKEILKQTFKENFGKGGSKKLIKILKDEFRDIEVKIGINVAGKQKDLVNLSDKILSIFQFVFANPQGFQQAMQIPALAKSFNDILEFSGLNQSDFLSLITPTAPSVLEQPAQPSPIQLNSPQPQE